ncbi:MAG TPA: FGGY family carbohydrate kinase [Pirellulales bacterium]|nr:FGGY family carbohydrate kinase [Pirellulales bacterium]
MKCLGIDIGSTSIKGAVLDLPRRSVGNLMTCEFPAPLTGLPAGWIEIDPRAVCEAVRRMLSALIEAAPEADRLYCTGQMGGLILVDDEGQSLGNFISWRDQRTLAPASSGEPLLDELRGRWEQAGVFVGLGRELPPGATTALLAWLRQHERLPSLAMPTTIADFVLGRLIGKPIPMHVTQAVGMLDLPITDWHHEALELAGLNELRLPSLARREEPVGDLSLAGRRLQVFGSYGDQQCALRGVGLQRDELSLNISTGSQVSRRSAEFLPGPYLTRKYFFGDYLNTVTHLPAGRSLNTLVDLLTELARAEGIALRDPWKTIHRATMAVETTDLSVDLAFFRGPLGSHGRIDGITTENLSVGHLFHAAFRAMADNYARVAGGFGRADWKAVVLSGGLTQSAPRLRQVLDQRFPVPTRESAGEETLLGLLDIALSTAP